MKQALGQTSIYCLQLFIQKWELQMFTGFSVFCTLIVTLLPRLNLEIWTNHKQN